MWTNIGIKKLSSELEICSSNFSLFYQLLNILFDEQILFLAV